MWVDDLSVELSSICDMRVADLCNSTLAHDPSCANANSTVESMQAMQASADSASSKIIELLCLIIA